MINTALVSIIIPTYNSENTIERALKSCLDQTIDAKIEIIIIDDNSSDRTILIVKDFLDRTKRLGFTYRIILKNLNQGPAAARNEGIKAAKGRYIAFLDSDDYWAPEKLKISIEFLKNSPDADLVGHAYNLEQNKELINNGPTRKISTLSLLFRNPMATPTIVFHSSINILFDEKMRFAEDHDFLLRISEKNNIYIIQIPTDGATTLGRPILSDGGLSANKIKMRLGEMQMLTNFCIRRTAYLPLLPFLLAVSFTKHLKKILK